MKNDHDNGIWSLYVLADRDLVSSFLDIKIWRINESDYKLTITLNGHKDYEWKVIEIKDGKYAHRLFLK